MRKEFVILILAVGLLLILLATLNWKMGKEKEDMVAQISETKKEIARYKSLAVEVTKAKEAQKVLQDKLNIINSLRDRKSVV